MFKMGRRFSLTGKLAIFAFYIDVRHLAVPISKVAHMKRKNKWAILASLCISNMWYHCYIYMSTVCIQPFQYSSILYMTNIWNAIVFSKDLKNVCPVEWLEYSRCFTLPVLHLDHWMRSMKTNYRGVWTDFLPFVSTYKRVMKIFRIRQTRYHRSIFIVPGINFIAL